MRTITAALLLFATTNLVFEESVSASSGWIIYHESAFKGKVIDAETKEPIEGAVVVAIYNIREASIAESGGSSVDVKEVLTDKNGQFYIPPHTFFYFYPVASGDVADFIIYKPGYTAFPGPAYDYFYKYFPYSPLRIDRPTLAVFFKKGVTVELLKLKTKEERINNISSGPTGFGSKKLPLLFKSINEERKGFGFEEVE